MTTTQQPLPGSFIPSNTQTTPMPGPTQDRNEAFAQGAVHGSAGLEQQQANYDRNAPRAFAPNSLRMQYAPSANGLGQSDASRRLPMGAAVLGTSNGQPGSAAPMPGRRTRSARCLFLPESHLPCAAGSTAAQLYLSGFSWSGPRSSRRKTLARCRGHQNLVPCSGDHSFRLPGTHQRMSEYSCRYLFHNLCLILCNVLPPSVPQDVIDGPHANPVCKC